MKLAVVTTYATPANMRRELLELVRARGHEVTMIAPDPADKMGPALARLGGSYRVWPVNRTGIDPVGDARSLRALFEILREERPDTLFVYQVKSVLLAPWAAKLARIPRVVALVNGLGAVFDERGFGRTWKARIARTAYGLSLRAVDAIVFQNHDDPALLRERGLLPASARWSVVAGSGVDLEKLTARPAAEGPPTFTLISRLLVSKGIRELVDAARTIKRSHPHARFWLVGQFEAAGHPDAVQREEVDRWVAEGLIEYRGFSDDVAGILAATTVFVLPSYYREGVPRTNLEALAVGRAVVTTDWVGCRDTVEDGVTGFLVPPRDAAALADRLERYLRDPGLAGRHGRAGRQLAERKFDIRSVNAQLLEILEGGAATAGA